MIVTFHTHVCAHKYTYAHIYKYICTKRYTYAQAYTYTHAYTYIHTHGGWGEVVGLGGLGSLMEKAQHLRSSACLLHRIEQGAEIITYS